MSKEVSFTIKVDDKGTLKKVTMDAEQLGRAVRSVQDESEKAKRSVLTWAETAQAIDADGYGVRVQIRYRDRRNAFVTVTNPRGNARRFEMLLRD